MLQDSEGSRAVARPPEHSQRWPAVRPAAWEQRTSEEAARWPMSAHLRAICSERRRSFSSSGSTILSEALLPDV
jgi:hypothetical protein